MLAITKCFLLVARTLPVLKTGARKPTSAEREFHQLVDAKLPSYQGNIKRMSHDFINAAFFEAAFYHAGELNKLRNACRMHRLHEKSQQRWEAVIGNEQWYQRMMERIDADEPCTDPILYLG